MSDTEWLERNLSWSGLLVQPDPRDYFNLRKHGREQSQSIHACLSPTCYPKEVRILLSKINHEKNRKKINNICIFLGNVSPRWAWRCENKQRPCEQFKWRWMVQYSRQMFPSVLSTFGYQHHICWLLKFRHGWHWATSLGHATVRTSEHRNHRRTCTTRVRRFGRRLEERNDG